MQEVVRDPTGAEVVLTDECWSHIIQSHPEMASHKELVLQTIKTPDAIYQGKRDPTRNIYSKKYQLVEGTGNWLDLLVFVGKDNRHVATAYFSAHSLRMLGKKVWPSE